MGNLTATCAGIQNEILCDVDATKRLDVVRKEPAAKTILYKH
jgi:hypothetical protein